MACISNGAYITAAEDQASAIRNQAITDTLIYAALALWQRNSATSIANMQNEIADRQLKLAEAVHDHAKKFWPYEKAIVDDAFAMNKQTPQYGALSAQWAAIADDSLRTARTDWLQVMRDRCLAPTKCEAARWDRVAQTSRADIISFADRQAEARAEALNDQRYSIQYSALGLGHGILNEINSYSDLSGYAGMSAGGILANSINSGLEALGYYRTRNDAPGWGSRAQVALSTAPYQPARGTTQPQVAPAAPPSPNCGPEPSSGDPAWNDWNRCMGFQKT